MALKTASSLFLVLATAGTAWAINGEYYTYGGFAPITHALQMVSLILSDSGYMSIIYDCLLGGLILGGIVMIVNAVTDGKLNFTKWILSILLGWLVFIGFVNQKGTITVYDPTLNAFQTMNGIPNGLVVVASTLNLVERGFVNVAVTASAQTINYQNGSGGLGFQALMGATQNTPVMWDNFFAQTLDEYNEKCVMFATLLPSSGLTVDDILTGSDDLLTLWGKAQNPAVYTVVYDEDDPAGVPMTCDATFTYIQNTMNDPDFFDVSMQTICSNVGFDSSNSTQLQQCKSTIGSTLNLVYPNATLATDASTFMRQVGIAKSLEYTLQRLGPTNTAIALSNQGIMNAGIPAGIVADQTIPILRAIFTAVGIVVVPVLFLSCRRPLLSTPFIPYSAYFYF